MEVKMNRYLLLPLLFIVIAINLSFSFFERTKGKFQREGYHFFLIAMQHIQNTGKYKVYASEVMYFKGYEDCDRNLDYQYYGIVKEKFMKYIADKYKIQSVIVNREGGKKSDYGYIETKEIGAARLNKYLSKQADMGNETIKTDFNFNCSDLK